MKTIAIALTLVAAGCFQSASAVEAKTGSPLMEHGSECTSL